MARQLPPRCRHPCRSVHSIAVSRSVTPSRCFSQPLGANQQACLLPSPRMSRSLLLEYPAPLPPFRHSLLPLLHFIWHPMQHITDPWMHAVEGRWNCSGAPRAGSRAHPAPQVGCIPSYHSSRTAAQQERRRGRGGGKVQ